MKNLSLITVLLFFTSGLYSQESEHAKFHYKDSIELVNTWKKFKISLESRDTKSLRQLFFKDGSL